MTTTEITVIFNHSTFMQSLQVTQVPKRESFENSSAGFLETWQAIHHYVQYENLRKNILWFFTCY